MDEKLLSEIKKIDAIGLEEYWSYDKTKAWGMLIMSLESDDKNKKFLLAEASLLNNSMGSDIWKIIMDELNKKPDFWSYDGDVIEYFEDRLKQTPPNITAARINYYLWTANNKIDNATKCIELFIESGLEHSKGDPEKYYQMPKFGFEFSYKFSLSLSRRDIIKTLLIPKMIEAIKFNDNNRKSCKYLSLVKLYLEIAMDVWQELGSDEKKFTDSLLTRCHKMSDIFSLEGNYHLANNWIEFVKDFYQRTKDSNKVDEIKRKQLNNIIKMAEQNPSPLLKSIFYQDAITYMQKNNINDSKLKDKTMKLFEEFHEKSLACFKTVETEASINKDDINNFIESILGDEKIPENIIRKLSNFLLPSYSNQETESKKQLTESLAVIIPVGTHSNTFVSRMHSSESERLKYEILNQISVGLQFNSPIIRKALETESIDHDVINQLIEKSRITHSSKEIIKRGVERHFFGDYISSLHILSFQVEELIRNVMKERGYSNFVFDPGSKSLRQRMLGALITDAEVQNVFGKDFTIAVEAYLSDPEHRNLRNEAGHGVIDLEKLREIDSLVVLFLNLYVISNFLT